MTRHSDEPRPEQMLAVAIHETLSPQAVALIAAKCQPAAGVNDAGRDAEREVAWFTNFLVDLLGEDEFNRICDELYA